MNPLCLSCSTPEVEGCLSLSIRVVEFDSDWADKIVA